MIRLVGVEKKFADQPVLQGVDLTIPVGKMTTIIGSSGSGKSVLLKHMIGLLQPDHGEVWVDDVEISRLSGTRLNDVRKRFAMLFQGAALFDSLSVWENVAFGLIHAMGASRDEARPIALRNMAAVGLPPEVGDLSPAELSGGMKKRVGLARAIASEPEILFFDEPTTGLDPLMGDIINDLIVHCVEQTGATAVTITHDMQSARKIADRIAMIFQGKIIWVGGVDEIDRTDEPHVKQFIHGRTNGPIQMAVRQ
ncbi:MAG: ABC transporter ATP-binding protein [Gammaproteobacteria bacterium]